ncbi:MAG: DNA primase [Planctomycetes bacterium]|nr:DNA primase [Planctomycetota bacterium]
MSSLIPPEKISAIQGSLNLLDLVSQYITLTRRGGNYVGLCPFHREKTPSFVVNEEKQLYKCFGCGENGTIFNFLMKQDAISFPEAVKALAEKANIPLMDFQQHKKHQKTDVLYEAHEQAIRFFSNLLLNSEEGKQAKGYLANRSITDDTIRKFRLGYSPNRWDAIVTKSREWHTSNQILERAGLIIQKKSGGFYDRFRNRLMFPIFNIQNKSVGFGARTLDKSSAKYLNSPETEIFHKSKTLFGLNLAKSSMIKKRRILIMEGYTDVIMAHQCGIDWSIALLGTALTREHVKILKRYCDKVTLVLDPDNAGQRSSEKSLDLFIEEDLDARVILLPENHDPYDFLVKRGAQQFLEQEEKAYDFLSFKIKLSKTRWDTSSVNGKASAIDDILLSATKIPNILKRELMIKRIAEEMSLEENILRAHLSKFQPKQKQKWNTTKIRSPEEPTETVSKLKSNAHSTIEKTLLAIMVNRNDLIKKIELDLGFESFHNIALRNVAIRISEIYTQTGHVELKDVYAFVENRELVENIASTISRQKALEASSVTGQTQNSERVLNDCIRYVQKRKKREALNRAKKNFFDSSKIRGQGITVDTLLTQFHEKSVDIHS